VLRSEIQLAVGFVQKHRLLTETVSREHKGSARRIPDRHREHAVELLDEGVSVALVQMDDDLGVRTCAEGVALLRELVTKLVEVVDLPVENGPDVFVFATLRLIAGDEVDDAKTPDTKTRVWIAVLAGRIRPAVDERFAHPTHHGGPIAFHDPHNACDPTHQTAWVISPEQPGSGF